MGSFLFLSFLIPPLGLPLGLYGLYKDFANWRKYLFCLMLTTFAFSYLCPILFDGDLSRYCESMDVLMKVSFFDVFDVGYRPGTSAYGFAVWEWIVANTGDYRLCWSVLVAISYFVFMYIACKIATNYRIHNVCALLYLVFQLVTINFFYMNEACRNFVAFAMVGVAVFRDLYEHKKDLLTLLLYVLPVFFHNTAIILVGLRTLVFFVKRFMILSFIGALLVKPFVDFLYLHCYNYLHLDFAGDFICRLIEHAYRYLNGQVALKFAQSVANNILFDFYKWSCVIIAVVFCLSVLYLVKHKNVLIDVRGRNIGDYLVWVYSVALLVFVGAQMATPEYQRFTNALVGFGAPVFLLFLSYKGNVNRKWINVVFLVAPFCLLNWMPMIYKSFFEMLINSFFTSPLLITIFDIFDIEFFASLCGIFG